MNRPVVPDLGASTPAPIAPDALDDAAATAIATTAANPAAAKPST